VSGGLYAFETYRVICRLRGWIFILGEDVRLKCVILLYVCGLLEGTSRAEIAKIIVTVESVVCEYVI
jgi:hypothetical protein